MFEFKTRVALVLAADPLLTQQLNTVLDTNAPAIYVNHLSHFQRVHYPCLSLFWEGVGADQAVQFAEGGVLAVDIWTEEREPQGGSLLAAGLSGAWALRRIVKNHLHRAHLNGALSDPAYAVSYCVELGGIVTDDFDRNMKLYHLQDRYRVRLVPTGAIEALPT